MIAPLVFSNCKSLKKDSEVRAYPADQPLSFSISPTISCDIAPTSKTIRLNHPVTGKALKLTYKNSNEIDYLKPGWEERITKTSDFFSAINLGGYNSDEMKATVIDIRNVRGRPHYHYFSNGTSMQTVQNLSATKFMGASFSIHRIRQLSDGQIGADIRYNTRVLASDLDVIGKQSDNQYAASVKTIGGNLHAEHMMENWLLAGYRDPSVTGSNIDYFGGSWGARADFCGESQPFPPQRVKDLNSSTELTLPQDRGSYRNWNHVSGLTFTEWMKRIAINFRDPVTLPKMINYKTSRSKLASYNDRLRAKPSLTKRDIQLLMYGSSAYSKQEFNKRGLNGEDCGGQLGRHFSQHEGKPRGGMMWDGLRDWPQNAGGVKRLDSLFGDRWRTLGKGGSSFADNKEAVIGYLCLPKIKKRGKVVFPGRELVVHIYYENKHKRPGNNYTHVHRAAKTIIEQMVPGLVSGGKLKKIGKGDISVIDNVEKKRDEAISMSIFCEVQLPPSLGELDIWEQKNPYRGNVGSYKNGEKIEIISQSGNATQTPDGFINGSYIKKCRRE